MSAKTFIEEVSEELKNVINAEIEKAKGGKSVCRCLYAKCNEAPTYLMFNNYNTKTKVVAVCETHFDRIGSNAVVRKPVNPDKDFYIFKSIK